MADKQDISAADYKAQVFKRRIAELVLQYEEMVATQATRIAQLESEIRNQEGQSVTADQSEEDDG